MTTDAVQSGSSPHAGVRIDVWLWASRFFRTRMLAKEAVVGGKVQLAGAACKPSKLVHPGQRLAIARGEERFEVVVLALSEKRGSAAVAHALYQETPESVVSRAAAAEQRRLDATGYRKPEGKPDKRARRLIRALGDIDSL